MEGAGMNLELTRQEITDLRWAVWRAYSTVGSKEHQEVLRALYVRLGGGDINRLYRANEA
jgi:hypothetical protein